MDLHFRASDQCHPADDQERVYKSSGCFLPSCNDLDIPKHYDVVETSHRGYTGSDLYDAYRNHFGHDLLPPHSTIEFPTDDLPLCLEALCEDRRFMRHRRLIHSPGLQLDGIRYGTTKGRIDPYSAVCMVPLPDHFEEPCFIRRRNERERERVRCVNEGYSRLKEHLPCGGKERRMSKVETLRGAINYIHQLQRLLENDKKINKRTKNNNNSTKNNNNNNNNNMDNPDRSLTKLKKRAASLSSSEPDSPDSFT